MFIMGDIRTGVPAKTAEVVVGTALHSLAATAALWQPQLMPS
jgi:hypothetical protein